MKIHERTASRMTEFEELSVGDIFECAGDIFMKLRQFYDVVEEPFNAVALKDGETEFFLDDRRVRRVEAELTYS